MKRLIVSLVLLLGGVASVSAHRASDSFLVLAPDTGATLRGHWDVALTDLAYALDLYDTDGVVRWGTLAAREADVAALLSAGLSAQSERGACRVQVGELALIQHSDGTYARLPLFIGCPKAAQVRLVSQLLLDADLDHRSLLRFGAEDAVVTHVLSQARPAVSLPLGAPRAALGPVLWAQLRRGVVHIFEGIDHIAFLLVLLLPVVFLRDEEPASRKRLWLSVAKLVTAFTLAHSLTLSLAALGWVRTAADVIEPAIAASVALAALRNLWPRALPEGAWLAFALGLLHGFGFASALADAGLSGAALGAALLGFNLGVELGQLVIVMLFVPLALLLVRGRRLHQPLCAAGSLAVLALALFWVFERLQTG